MSSFAQNATAVLVHGAWADGSCWRSIVLPLRREGLKVTCAPGKTKRSWFLLAEEHRMVAPETQRYMAERMGAKIRAQKVDHTPMHTEPDVVVSVILEAARETLAC